MLSVGTKKSSFAKDINKLHTFPFKFQGLVLITKLSSI